MRQDAGEIGGSVKVVNAEGRHPVVLVCEHASRHIPSEYGTLGLSEAALRSHIAWDPGALDTATFLSARLDAPLVHGTVSRLIYDCNRPPEAASAMPVQSEATIIPGNQSLDPAARQARVDAVYRPFEACLSQVLRGRPLPPVVVTIHSFTPVYMGQSRAVEIGILHDADSRLADALLQVASGFRIERNQPYGPEDGVTYTLIHHALPDYLNVMIEIRNDLIATTDQCRRMADHLYDWLSDSLAMLSVAQPAEEGQ